MKTLYKYSKSIHKWTSIIISIFIVWMGISGILLNHPELISKISVPKSMIPANYYFENWNRSSISDYKYFQTNKNLHIIGGYEGIFVSTDGGKHFNRLITKGLPNSQYYCKTKSVYLLEDSIPKGILAGTFGGLYYYNFEKRYWKKLKLEEENEKVVKILDYKDSIAVFSSSNLYLMDKQLQTNPKKVELLRDERNNKLTFIELFFQLHTGEIWGISGKIIFDIAGLAVVFLSMSGLLIWILPKTSKIKIKLNGKIKEIKWYFYKLLYDYHLKIGIYVSLILLIIGITGFFMRPPAIAIILDGEIDTDKIPFLKINNPWHDRIRNAMYDKVNDVIILDAKDGFWISNNGENKVFKKKLPPVPIFAMGATVMEMDSNCDYIIGSFSGLFKISTINNKVVDALSGKAPMNISLIRPGSNLITSYFTMPNGEEFITTHFDGLRAINNVSDFRNYFIPPTELINNFRMPLWNYLFELHNGRIFQFLIGDLYILIIPLGAILFVLSIITGIFDWLHIKINEKKQLNRRIKIINYNLEEIKEKELEKI